jgi:hypothetical protein
LGLQYIVVQLRYNHTEVLKYRLQELPRRTA